MLVKTKLQGFEPQGPPAAAQQTGVRSELHNVLHRATYWRPYCFAMHACVAPTNRRVSCSFQIQPQKLFAYAGNYLEIRESKLEICIACFQRVVSDKMEASWQNFCIASST